MTIVDIGTLTRFLTNTDSNSLTNANLLILINKHYEQITGRIISETAGARSQWGDMNYTGFQTFTVNMTNGVQSYDLNDWVTTTSAQTIASSRPLTIMGVEVADNSGTFHPLKRTSLREIHNIEGQAQTEYYKTNGLPQEYEMRDNLIVLYPAPATANVTLTAGLKLFYLRSGEVFSSMTEDSSGKEPGFPAPWHDLLSYGPAYDYAVAKGLPNANNFKLEYDRRMEEMLDFISRRDQAENYQFTTRKKNFR